MRRPLRSGTRATVLLLTALLVPSGLYAQECGAAGEFASAVWAKYIEEAREAGCLAPVQGPRKFMACAISAPANSLHLVDRMVGWWNSMASGGWATFGPRRLGPTWQSGTVWGTSGRLWMGTAPVHSKTTVEVTKRDGRAPAQIIVCATNEDGSTRKLAHRRFSKGNDNKNQKHTIQVPDPAAEVLSVKVDGTGVIPTNKLKYRIQLTTEPIEYDLSPVEGFADLHIHQAAELGFGGNQIWGSHIGPQDEALPDHGRDALEQAVLDGPVEWALGLHSLPGVLLNEGESRHGPGYPSFERWPHFNDVTHQQVHEDWLKSAHERGLNLIVVSAVNFEGFCYVLKAMYPRPDDRMGCRDMESVETQIEAFIEMDEERDWYEIAVHPWHARKIIHDGNLAVVISMEASHLLPLDEGDFVVQLDRLWGMGMRTLQLAHETDSRFAGAAPHRDLFEAFQYLKWAPYRTGVQGFVYDDEGKNAVGLTPQGVDLVEAMIDRRMLVDVAHLSERSVQNLHQLVATEHDYYPLYDSHTRFKAILTNDDREIQQEFLTTEEQIRAIRETGGMVGLRTGQNAIRTVEGDDGEGVANDCDGSSKSFAQLVHYGEQAGIQMGLGSDFNGFINQLGPRYGPEACPRAGVRLDFVDDDGEIITDEDGDPISDPRKAAAAVAEEQRGSQPESLRNQCKVEASGIGTGRDFDTEGLRHVGYLPGLISDLEALETPGVEVLKSSAEAFLRMWERAYDPDRTKIEEDTDLPRQVADAVPDWTPCGSLRQSLGVHVFLEGDWLRTSSNNPVADGMRIRVEGDEATLTAMPQRSQVPFSVGQVLWQEITEEGTLEVRGSNGRYYSAVLTMEGEDRVHIDIDNNPGPGYDQTWQRAGPSIDGEWVLVAAGETGDRGMRIRVEGDRATLHYVPAAASRAFRTGDIVWRAIGAGEQSNSGRLEALSGDRSYRAAEFRLQNEDRLRLVIDADGTAQSWARPGVAEELMARAGEAAGAVADIARRPGFDPSSVGKTLVPVGEIPTLAAIELAAAEKRPAVVVGLTFRDLDGDGTHDPGEPGLAGVTVRVVDLNSGEAGALATNADGLYRFEAEGGVHHRFAVEPSSLPPDVIQTSNPPEYELEVSRGFTVPNVNFGYGEK